MSDGIMITIGDDGEATLYDDTYDITIHCESKEEQDEVWKVLQNVPHWIPVTEEPKESGKYLVTAVIGFIPDHVDDPNTYEAVTTANYSADTRDPIKWWGNNVEKVLAWMPLPEPYRG